MFRLRILILSQFCVTVPRYKPRLAHFSFRTAGINCIIVSERMTVVIHDARFHDHSLTRALLPDRFKMEGAS